MGFSLQEMFPHDITLTPKTNTSFIILNFKTHRI